MGFQRLVQIQAGQALHIEAGEPHGADKHDPERVGRIFEFLVQLPLFHFFAVRLDIQAPLLEGLNLILFLTDDHSHFRFLHPLQLAFQLLCLLLRGVFDLNFQRFNFSRPIFLDQIIHANTGHLIQANKHGFPACPQIGVMAHKIPCDGFQAGRCCQQMDLFGKLCFQLVLLIYIQICLLNGIQNAVCNFRVVFHIQNFLAAVFVVQRHSCTILYSSLEVIHRYVATEGALGDVIAGQ